MSIPTGNSKINIYLDEEAHQEIRESPSMTFSTFLSNEGGVIGMFIGISVLTLAQLILKKVLKFVQNNELGVRT